MGLQAKGGLLTHPPFVARVAKWPTRNDMPEETPVKPSVFPTAQYPAAEGILEWPVFEGLGLQLHGRSLALIHQDNHQFPSNPGTSPIDSRSHGQVSSSTGVDIFKDALPSSLVIESAIKDFLANVHTKNPILDPATLAEAAEDCTKHGIGDSVQAALVVSTLLNLNKFHCDLHLKAHCVCAWNHLGTLHALHL